jgi:hypothetical protein
MLVRVVMCIFRDPAFLLVGKQGMLVLWHGLIQKNDDEHAMMMMMMMSDEMASMRLRFSLTGVQNVTLTHSLETGQPAE